MPDCEYCNHSFSSRSNMLYHQKTTKYCLGIRNKINSDFSCKYCNVLFTNKYKFKNHEENCSCKDICIEHDNIVSRLNQRILELNYRLKESENNIKNLTDHYETEIKHITKQHKDDQVQIRNLQLSLEKLAESGINKHTNKIRNVQVNMPVFAIDVEKFKETIHGNLTINHVLEAPLGLSDFICDNIIPAKNGQHPYICTDAERRNFKFNNESGIEIVDKKGHMLWSSVKDPLFDTCGKLLIQKAKINTNQPGNFDAQVCLEKSVELDKYKDGTAIMGNVAARTYKQKTT